MIRNKYTPYVYTLEGERESVRVRELPTERPRERRREMKREQGYLEKKNRTRWWESQRETIMRRRTTKCRRRWRRRRTGESEQLARRQRRSTADQFTEHTTHARRHRVATENVSTRLTNVSSSSGLRINEVRSTTKHDGIPRRHDDTTTRHTIMIGDAAGRHDDVHVLSQLSYSSLAMDGSAKVRRVEKRRKRWGRRRWRRNHGGATSL